MTEPNSNLNRRTFLQAGAAGLTVATMLPQAPPRRRVQGVFPCDRWAGLVRR